MSTIIYVLSNAAMPGLLKIGKTDRADPLRRMGELYTTGVPLPFECELAVAVEDDAVGMQVEAALHRAFAPHRVNPKREFFRMDLEQVEAILKVWPGAEDVTDRARRDLDAHVEQDEREAVKRERSRRPRLDLSALGIRAGDTLVFTGTAEGDPSVEVVDPVQQTVLFGGEPVQLREATYEIMGLARNTPLRQGAYWAFNGRGLVELYEELHAG